MSMRNPVVRDPNHPDFPHGTPAGQTRGCPCGPCGVARNRQNKRTKYLRQRGVSVRVASPATCARVEQHVRALLEVAPAAAVARAAGVGASTVSRTLATGVVSPGTAHAFLAVKVADVTATRVMVPAQESIRLTRTMQALGYPEKWQRARTGSSAMSRTTDHSAHELITVEAANAIRALADQIGDTPATPDMGLHPGAITYAKTAARRAGFYPPIYYDEDGTLDWRALPDHPWSRDNEEADKTLLMATLVCAAEPGSAAQIGARLKELDSGYATDSDEAIDRAIDRMRLRLKVGDIRDGYATARTNRAKIRAAINDFESGLLEGGPVRFCLDHGLWSKQQGSTDHPDKVAWREALAEQARAEKERAEQTQDAA